MPERPNPLASKTITPITRTFLEGVENQYRPTDLAPDITAIQTRIKTWSKAVIDDRAAFEDMMAAEPDAEVRAVLGEYEQTLGAMERELSRLRTAVSNVGAMARQIGEIEVRIGAVLRATTP